jgi:hypothetical protein
MMDAMFHEFLPRPKRLAVPALAQNASYDIELVKALGVAGYGRGLI